MAEMKKKKENKESLESLINHLKAIYLKDSSDRLPNDYDEMADVLARIDSQLTSHKKQDRMSSFIVIALALISICMTLMSSLTDDENRDLKADIQTKQNIIRHLQKTDSLFHYYMNVDSSGTYSYRIKNGEPLTYKEIVSELDRVREKHYKTTNRLEDSLWIKNAVLDLIHKRIPFSYKVSKTKDNHLQVTIDPSVIDSAMIFYDYGKENLEYRFFNGKAAVRPKQK